MLVLQFLIDKVLDQCDVKTVRSKLEPIFKSNSTYAGGCSDTIRTHILGRNVF